jgi:hypothetical protein
MLMLKHRQFVCGLVTGVLVAGAGAVAAQQIARPLSPEPPPPQAAVPATRPFTADAGLMFSVIKPDKVADYESVMARVKETLSKSTDPKRKQQALGWRVMKGLETGIGGNIVYVWLIDPPAKGADYTVTDILREAFPTEVQDLWAKYVACFVNGQVMLNMQQTLTMGPTQGKSPASAPAFPATPASRF